jgi:hypothetical protein
MPITAELAPKHICRYNVHYSVANFNHETSADFNGYFGKWFSLNCSYRYQNDYTGTYIEYVSTLCAVSVQIIAEAGPTYQDS